LDDAQSDSLNLHITAREEWNEESYTLEWNISKQVRGFMLGFGNGVWVEIRIVAETQYAVEITIRCGNCARFTDGGWLSTR